MDTAEAKALLRSGACDPALMSRRFALARQAAEVFHSLSGELLVAGRLVGGDRIAGMSPWGNGSDETVAVALLLDVGSELIDGCVSLFAEAHYYGGAALLRQLVEVEHLAWAFETRDRDGERWLRSTREEREEFFRPARLRRAASGRFRGQDYGYHCELGGHPVPQAEILLRTEAGETAQLLLSDALGHVGHIWNHVRAWAVNRGYADSVLRHGGDMPERHRDLWAVDPLVRLPLPP